MAKSVLDLSLVFLTLNEELSRTLRNTWREALYTHVVIASIGEKETIQCSRTLKNFGEL